jgi:putative acetyltransferase
MTFTPGDLDDPRVIELLTTHLTTARAQTAPGSAHALDLRGPRSPDIRFWTAWEGDRLLGTAALKRLSPSHGEIKSMHTAVSHRRRGVAGALLQHLIEAARADGVERLSLETGSSAYFAPARALYASFDFKECPPFGNYVLDPNSVFMSLALDR